MEIDQPQRFKRGKVEEKIRKVNIWTNYKEDACTPNILFFLGSENAKTNARVRDTKQNIMTE